MKKIIALCLLSGICSIQAMNQEGQSQQPGQTDVTIIGQGLPPTDIVMVNKDLPPMDAIPVNFLTLIKTSTNAYEEALKKLEHDATDHTVSKNQPITAEFQRISNAQKGRLVLKSAALLSLKAELQKATLAIDTQVGALQNEQSELEQTLKSLEALTKKNTPADASKASTPKANASFLGKWFGGSSQATS